MGRALQILHGQERELFRVQEFSEVCKDQVNVLSRVRGLAGSPKKQSLLEQVEKGLVLVNTLLSDLEVSSLFPQVRH